MVYAPTPICRVRGEAERKAINSTIQGSAADIMKRAMCTWCCWHARAGHPPVRIVAQVGKAAHCAAAGRCDSVGEAALPDPLPPRLLMSAVLPHPLPPVLPQLHDELLLEVGAEVDPVWAAQVRPFLLVPACGCRAAVLVCPFTCGRGRPVAAARHLPGPLPTSHTAQELRQVMESAWALRVPLLVKVQRGERWGSMAPM